MFGFDVAVPKGKKVQFSINELRDTEMILESDLTIKADSQFVPLLDFKLTGWGLAIEGLAKGIIEDLTKKRQQGYATTKQAGFRQWTGTSPLMINFTVGLHRKTDTYKDVVQPAQILLSLAVPKLNDDGNSMEAPGLTLYEMLRGKKHGLAIYAGPCTIYDCNIETVEPTISEEVDSNGYPIWIKLTIGAVTMYTANNKMMYNLFSLNNNSEEVIDQAWEEAKRGIYSGVINKYKGLGQ